MSTPSGEGPLWWDRDLDLSGKPLRADVRSAACQIWEHARQLTRTFLGDPCEAAGLMESAVAQISRYLDRRAVPLVDQDASALVMCAFYRCLRRHVVKLRRAELAAETSVVPQSRIAQACTNKEDCRLDAEKAIRQLSERARQMFELRRAGYEWKEIAQVLHLTDAAARAEFSRELRRIRVRLRNKRLAPANSSKHNGSIKQPRCNS